MRRPIILWFGTARVVVALRTRRNTLPVAPWLNPPIVVSVRGRNGTGAARGRMCTPRVVPPLAMPRDFDRSSGVWAAIAVIVGASLCSVAGRSGVRTMARLCRGGVIVVIGSPVRIGRCPSAIGGPIAHSSEIVGRPSALGAAVAVDAQSRRRAATAGSCTPPAGAGAVRSHQRQARCGESLAVGRGRFDQGQPSQCRKKFGLLSPKAALGRSRPRANPTCLRTLQVRWIPTSRSAKRNGGSSPLSWQSRRHVHGPAWLVRTGVLVWLRSRSA